MAYCGIDVGARTVKVVILNGKSVIGKAMRICGVEIQDDISDAYDEALELAKISKEAVRCVTATGSGREAVTFANEQPTGITCAARGINFVNPEIRMLLDIGAEEGRAIQCDKGKVLNFVVNEKCAAGAGTFIENMSRAIEISVDEFGPLALRATNLIAMNAQCAVFAESEVVSLIHSKTPKEDIARAVCEAMAGRIGSMTRRLAITPPVALIGGVSRNAGFVRAIENDLKSDIFIPPDAEYISALGAALISRETA